MKVCVIGTGYVGLVTGVCLAQIGHDVLCIDNNSTKIAMIQAGKSPIHEPGLPEMMQAMIDMGNLKLTTDLAAGVKHGEILFITVETPPLPDGSSDVQYVEAVARGIGQHLNEEYKVIVNKSTVPIGFGNQVRALVIDGINEKMPGSTLYPTTLKTGCAAIFTPKPQFDVVSNPEFLREGSAIYDTLSPDRIVLGGNSSPRAIDLMLELYTPIIERKFTKEDAYRPPVKVLVTDLGSAEMIKYAANAFLATKISFINEIANICECVGADVTQVSQGIGLDSRIGTKFLNAGVGWGGSCFPKDLAALIHIGEDYGYEAQLLKAVVDVNQRQRILVIEKLQQYLKILKGKTIGLLGLTFKPNTDDLREAPALDLILMLSKLGAKVKAYDPIVCSQNHSLPLHPSLQSISLSQNPEQLATDCDAIILMTEWQQFQDLNYLKLAELMRVPLIIDCRNFLSPQALHRAGFKWVGMGVPSP